MAVTESTLVVGPLVPDEGVTTISLDFFFERAEWLEVYRGASDEPLTLATDYTVSGEGTSQGSITLSEPADGDTPYAVYLVVPLERDSDFSPRADLRSRTVNQELDRVVQGAQGVRALAERGLRVSRTSPVPGAVHAPDVGERGTRLLRFSEDGERFELGVPEPDVAQLQEDAQRAADAAEAAEQSEIRAGEWAETPEDEPVVQFNGNQFFSAKHHAAKAAQSAALSNRVIYVATIADLQALDTSPLPDGQQVTVAENGNLYTWNSSGNEWDRVDPDFSSVEADSYGGDGVTQSSTDTTAGRLLGWPENERGIFGIGGFGLPAAAAELDAIERGGFYFLSDSIPNVANTDSFVMHVPTRSGTGAFQLLKRETDGNSDLFFRHKARDAAYSDWIEIYHTGNLVGTVSQSGGDPTGAVIERGSNSNGQYVRFADGTQICTNDDVASVSVEDQSGNWWRSESFTWDFPVSFADRPLTYGGISGTSGTDLNRVVGCFGQSSATQATIRVFSATGASSSTSRIGLCAVGRWF